MNRTCITLSFFALSVACGQPVSTSDGNADRGHANVDDDAEPTDTTDVEANPVKESANNVFVPTSDVGEQQRLGGDIWRVLTAQACWESTGSYLQQYAFFGADGFRYSGFDTHAGSVSVQAIGRFNGQPAALWSTWDTEFMALVDGGFATRNAENGLIVVYVPGTHGCL